MFNDGAGFGPITVGKSFGPNFILCWYLVPVVAIHVHCIDIRYLIGFKTRPATPTVGCKLNNTHHFHRISSNDFIDNSLPPPPLARRRCNNPIIPQLHTCTPSKRRLLA
jgi:hypothetical protein